MMRGVTMEKALMRADYSTELLDYPSKYGDRRTGIVVVVKIASTSKRHNRAGNAEFGAGLQIDPPSSAISPGAWMDQNQGGTRLPVVGKTDPEFVNYRSSCPR